MTVNLHMVASKFCLTGKLTDGYGRASDPFHRKSNKKPKGQRLLHQQRAVINNSVECIAKYKNHYISKETEAAQKLIARQERDAARDT